MRALLLASAVMLAAATTPVRAAPPELQQASIANGQSFDISPFSFYALYAGDVTFAGARLVDQDGKATPITPGVGQRARLVTFDLPVMQPHGYRLEWYVRDAGGAQTRQEVSFVVRGCQDLRAVPNGAARS
jgi:hypothetical protein